MVDAERIESSSMEQTVLVACLLLIYVDNVMRYPRGNQVQHMNRRQRTQTQMRQPSSNDDRKT